jgi:hypothetical protein
LIRVYQRERDRLQAEESLAAMQQVAVGSGTLSGSTGRDIQDEWRRRASRPGAAAATGVRLATDADAAALGIKVITVTP